MPLFIKHLQELVQELVFERYFQAKIWTQLMPHTVFVGTPTAIIHTVESAKNSKSLLDQLVDALHQYFWNANKNS